MPHSTLCAAGAALAATLLLARVARAQSELRPDDRLTDLRGVTTIAVGLGSAREQQDGGAGPSDATRLLGGARITHWLTPVWALDLSGARVGLTSALGVTSVLGGAAWYPRVTAAAPRLRPYVGASVGFFVRNVRPVPAPVGANVITPGRTETALGARLSAGVDAFVGRRVVVGALAGYQAAGRLAAVGAGEVAGVGGAAAVRPAGPMFAVTLGVVLPRREP